jgi:IclR family pca regulon transcriptional regulator
VLVSLIFGLTSRGVRCIFALSNLISQCEIMNPRHTIKSLLKGLSVLQTFADKRSALSLTEIAELNGISMATAHRYAATLTKSAYLSQDPDSKKYKLTFKVLDLGFAFLAATGLRNRVLPHMIEMTGLLDVTSQCAILEGSEIVYIERVRSRDVVNLDVSIGSRLPAYCTSMGKAILAFTDEKRRKAIVRDMDLEQITPYTITDKEALLKELKETRKRGYAINNEELSIGLQTLAAPIFNNGTVEGAIGFSIPSFRIEEGSDFRDTLASNLLVVSKKVSIGPLPV